MKEKTVPEFSEGRFEGMSEHFLDPKGRLTLPAQYRDHLIHDQTVILSVGFMGALAIWHPQMWEVKKSRPVEEHPRYGTRVVNNAVRFMTPVDAQARVRISVEFRKWCQLPGREVIVTGNDDHVLVWDRNRWNEFFHKELERMVKEESPPGI